MAVYIFLYMYILLSSFISSLGRDKYTKIINISISMLVVAIIGLRSLDLGVYDTANIYAPTILKHFNLSFEEILSIQKKDQTFYIFTKLISSIFPNINFILFIICVPYIYSVNRLIQKYSKIKYLSWILFVTLPYFSLSFYLLRQTVALAFILLAYIYIIECKPIKFLILVLVASLFHQTALVFIIAYPLVLLKPSLMHYLFILFSFLISIILKSYIFNSIFFILNIMFPDSSRYAGYENRESALNYTGFFILLLIFIVSVFFLITNIKKKNPYSLTSRTSLIQEDYYSLFNLSSIGIVIMAFSSLLGEFWRVSVYFSIFNIIFLPNAIYNINNKRLKYIVIYIFIIIFITYALLIDYNNSNLLPYKIFFL